MSGGQSISPLGNIGLGGSGMYSSYDPAMMAMMSGYNSGGYGSYGNYGMGMGMMGMMGMPDSVINQQMEMIKKMYETQHQIETQRLQQATDMHALTQQAEVYNLSAHDNAFFQKAMLDGYVQKGIREIYDAIREGNSKYALQKFYQLKQGILVNYSDYFNTEQGQKNTRENLDRLIQLLYTKIAGGYDPKNPAPDMINDIQQYSESPVKQGFNMAFLGEHGHNDIYGDQVLNQMFGRHINDAGSKHRAQQVGALGAHITEGALATGVGAAGATAAGGVAYGLTKGIAALFGQAKRVKFSGKVAGAVAGLGALLGLGADIWWQFTR